MVVRLPWCSSPAALPVLFRLWRGKGTSCQVDLAARMLTTLTAAFPGRIIHGVGDAAFHGQALICGNSTWTTRLPAKSVLYGPRPAPTGKRGRPRKKGARLGTPAQIAAGASCQCVPAPIRKTRPMPTPGDAGLRRLLSPWYRPKQEPAVADMLAKLGREFVKARFSAIRPGHSPHDLIEDYAWTCDTPAA